MDAIAVLKECEKQIISKKLLESQLEKREADLVLKKEKACCLQKAQALIQEVARQTQETLTLQIQDLAQSSIDTVFPGRYTFLCKFAIKRNMTECDIYLDSRGRRFNPFKQNGGGLVDIVSLSLRMACWSISQSDNVLLLDEPFKNLSAIYRPLIADIIRIMSKRLGLQIIMVTHDSELISIADRVFQTELKGRLRQTVITQL